MGKDKVIGFLIFLGSLVFGALYYIGITGYFELTVKILVSLAVLFMVLIGLWLGIEMMRTPSFEAPKEGKKAENK